MRLEPARFPALQPIIASANLIRQSQFPTSMESFVKPFRPHCLQISAFALLTALPAIATTPVVAQPASAPSPAIATVPGMPPVPDPANLYSETAANKLSAAVASDLARVYVPHIQSNDVYVIDPATFQVVDKFKVGLNPQHVVPSYDLRTLWVANNAENTKQGSLTPVDPKTGKPGKAIAVDDPYNMYFSPDGKSAIVVAEALHRLDFRDPKSMQLQYSIDVPACAGINHADFAIDGKYVIFTCEFSGTVAKIDLVARKVLGYTQVIQPGRPTKVVKGPDGKDEIFCTTWKGMPQDIRASPDGKLYFIADMMADGVHVVDGESFKQVGFIATGKGTHRIHDGRACGDRSTAQIIAVGEATRHHHEIGTLGQFGFGMPDHCRFMAGCEPERARHIAFAIDSGKHEDG